MSRFDLVTKLGIKAQHCFLYALLLYTESL